MVVKYKAAFSLKSKSSIQYFARQIVEIISDVVFRISSVRLQHSSSCCIQYKWPNNDDTETVPFIIYLFSIWDFFHNHSRITRLQGKGEGISLIPHYHFHLLHRLLDIARQLLQRAHLCT